MSNRKSVIRKDLDLAFRGLILGVTGGIASGKTTVATMMQDLGAQIIDFDLLAREVVEPGKPAWKKIVSYFGQEVVAEDGSLNRKKISQIVFKDPAKRKVLESITHPLIIDLFVSKAKALIRNDSNAIILPVIPLLFEAHLEEFMDMVIVVYIPREMQIERLMKRSHVTRDEAEAMVDAQMSIEEKLRRADFVLYNDKSLHNTKRQVEVLWESLKRSMEGGSENE